MKKAILAFLSLGMMAFATSTDVQRCGWAPNSSSPWGGYGVLVDGGPCVQAPIDEKNGSDLVGTTGETAWSIGGYDVDPFFNWSFTTSINGVHNVTFTMPFIGGPYDSIILSASGSSTSGKLGTSITAKNIKVTSLINAVATGQTVLLADTKTAAPKSGVIPADFNIMALVTPASGTYAANLVFEHVGEGSITINGRIELFNAIPEPATFGLIGTALLGLGLIARRRA